MYIQMKQDIRCSKCDSTNYESFSDARYTGLRCKKCGHETKELHPHLTQTSGTINWAAPPSRVITF